MNEVAQWVVLTILAFLMLGVFRQLSLMLPAPERIEAGGPDLGEAAPRELVSGLGETVAAEEIQERGALVAFVQESCPGCQRLVSDITSSRQTTNGQPIVLVTDQPSPEYWRAIGQSAIPAIADDGDIWHACKVAATPLVIALDASGKVIAKEVTHRVQETAEASA